MSDISVRIRDRLWSDALPGVEDRVAEIARYTLAASLLPPRCEHAEVSFLLTVDSEIQNLNKAYRGIDRPTNVLSFPTNGAGDHGPDRDELLGDVVLSYETVVSEAERDAKPLMNHVAHLVVHGTLHLLGFDHETDQDADKMEGVETRILSDLDIPDPYGGGASIVENADG